MDSMQGWHAPRVPSLSPKRPRSEADAKAATEKVEAVAQAAIAKARADAEAAAAAAKAEAMRKADATAKAAIATAQAEAKAAVEKAEAAAKAAAEKAEAALKTEAKLRVEASEKLEAANKALNTERAKLSQQVASLASQDGSGDSPSSPTGSALVREIKKELKRIGCYAGKLDDDWKSSDMKQSLAKFAKIASLTKAPDEPDAKFLNSVRSQITRVCPIECGSNEVESNGKCIAKAAPAAPSRPAAAPSRPAAAPRTAAAQDVDATAPIGRGGRRGGNMNWNGGGDTRVKCGKYGCSTWKRQ